MRYFALLALGAVALLIPQAHARELPELRERIRDAVNRTDKDLGTYVHRDKLNQEQREKFDAAVKDLGELREAVASSRWQAERGRLERAIDNIDFVVKHGPMDEGDRQTLGIDVYTLQTALDSWQQ